MKLHLFSYDMMFSFKQRYEKSPEATLLRGSICFAGRLISPGWRHPVGFLVNFREMRQILETHLETGLRNLLFPRPD